jgi:hypothetical protein
MQRCNLRYCRLAPADLIADRLSRGLREILCTMGR